MSAPFVNDACRSGVTIHSLLGCDSNGQVTIHGPPARDRTGELLPFFGVEELAVI